MSLLKHLLNKLQKNKLTPEEISQEESGIIVIEFTADNGNFTVFSEVHDLSAKSVETLGLLLCHIKHGNLNQYIYEALAIWAGEDKKKMEFNATLADYLNRLDEMILEQQQQNNPVVPKVAVDPSRVFNLRGLNE